MQLLFFRWFVIPRIFYLFEIQYYKYIYGYLKFSLFFPENSPFSSPDNENISDAQEFLECVGAFHLGSYHKFHDQKVCMIESNIF